MSFNGQCILSRLDEASVSIHSEIDLGEIYEQTGKNLQGSNNPNDKLKLRLLQEEYEAYQSLKANKEKSLELDLVEKRCLVSSADAILMAQAVNKHGDYGYIRGLLESAGKWLPFLTSWEAHNYAEFLNQVVSKASKSQEEGQKRSRNGGRRKGKEN